ncbi:hypothetical protein [Streptomyces pacificus]|uniref:Uncharacterized protein n=1 Tax=Streptomyces pacificus TaxID=2705029 RepID=A0A6A0AYT7_9ACTN|nr:hypothetical protein [Streptomyces pacificus]GFH37595.1 hypothetical protein SCWH03_38330 [Streptomyces pacificus]
MYDDGDGPPRPGGEREARARAAEVRVAFEGMLQIRRLTGAGPGAAAGPEAVPAPWERGRMVRAVALALEAAGIAPSAVDADSGRRVATGYRVAGVPDEPGMVRVEWLGPHGSGAAGEEERALADCARILGRLGWDALVYRGRSRRRFVEVRPPHPGG